MQLLLEHRVDREDDLPIGVVEEVGGPEEGYHGPSYSGRHLGTLRRSYQNILLSLTTDLKYNFKASWICRPGPEVVIALGVPALIVSAGWPKFGWLRALSKEFC